MNAHRLPAITSLTLLALAACIPAARADDSPLLASSRARVRALDGIPETEAGLVTAVGPGYLGGRNTQVQIAPYVEANLKNGLFFSSIDGIGYHLLQLIGPERRFSMGMSLSPSASRYERMGKDGDRNPLQGMGDVTPRAQANLFADFHAHRFNASLTLQQELGNRHGTGVELSARYDLYNTACDLVQAGAAVYRADRALTQTHFGVSPAQAASSGHPAYSPGGGFTAVGADVSWRHAFSDHWMLNGNAGAFQLRGDAADSPLIERKASAYGLVSVGYRF